MVMMVMMLAALKREYDEDMRAARQRQQEAVDRSAREAALRREAMYVVMDYSVTPGSKTRCKHNSKRPLNLTPRSIQVLVIL